MLPHQVVTGHVEVESPRAHHVIEGVGAEVWIEQSLFEGRSWILAPAHEIRIGMEFVDRHPFVHVEVVEPLTDAVFVRQAQGNGFDLGYFHWAIPIFLAVIFPLIDLAFVDAPAWPPSILQSVKILFFEQVLAQKRPVFKLERFIGPYHGHYALRRRALGNLLLARIARISASRSRPTFPKG